MRRILVLAFLVSVCAGCTAPPDPTPTAQAFVPMPRAELYSVLADQYLEIERKSATIQTVTGTPPFPVKFTFARREGEMLAMTGTAGFRTVAVKAWIENGEHEGESLLKVQFEPESLLKRSGVDDPYRALKITLSRTSAQFKEGQRITALFGK